MIGGAVISLAGVVAGAYMGFGVKSVGLAGGSMFGGQIAGQLNGFINSLAPNEQLTTSESSTKSSTVENKAVTDMMALVDE